MPSIRNRVRMYLYLCSVVMIAVLLLLFSLIQLFIARRQSVTDAEVMFSQIDQVLADNEKELELAIEDFKTSCLHNADTVAYIVEQNPELTDEVHQDDNITELRRMAQLVGVAEISVFDNTGRVIVATNSRAIGMTLDSVEQLKFFKPMLRDTSKRMYQEVTLSATESIPMLYAAVWNSSKTNIVMLGIEPDSINAVMARNDSSRVFSMLNTNEGVSVYAIDNDGLIVGSTDEDDVGLSADEAGVPLAGLAAGKNRFIVNLHGKVRAFCVVHKLKGGYVIHLESTRTLYYNIPLYSLVMFIALAVADLILIAVVHWYIRRHLIDSIDRVNASLTAIADGDLESHVDITDNREFSELSRHINKMIESILGNTDKISYVLQKANLNVGVYEYNRLMRRVRLTAETGRLFGVSEERIQELARNTTVFREFVEEIRSHILPDEENIYVINTGTETRYVKIEEINWSGDVFGVVIDMTETVHHRKQLEEERDIDLLTGLYNRRGAETRLAALFTSDKAMMHGAIVMMDADELKIVNDRYGHDDGDRYLRKVAHVMGRFPNEHRLAARVGGDEFVLLLHSYETEEELFVALRLLQMAQENTIVSLHNGIDIPLKFSYGYQLTAPGADYTTLLNAADTIMYENKRQRKESWKNETQS